MCAISLQVCAEGVCQQKSEEEGSGALEDDFLIDLNKKP